MKDINALLSEKLKNKDFERKFHRTSALFRLADEVLLLRKERGLTQKELAEKVGTTQAVISRLENASVKPSLETIIKIAEALDAAVSVCLTPFEEINITNTDECEESQQKEQIAWKGISYFNIGQELSKSEPDNAEWKELKNLSSLNISSAPPLWPVSPKLKKREFAG